MPVKIVITPSILIAQFGIIDIFDNTKHIGPLSKTTMNIRPTSSAKLAISYSHSLRSHHRYHLHKKNYAHHTESNLPHHLILIQILLLLLEK